MHNYILETDRLILRPLIVEDAEAVFAWVGDEDVARYMVYNTYETVEQVKGWLEYLKQEDEEYHFGFVRKEDNMLIGAGSIGPTMNIETNEKRDGFWGFGYNLRKDCWGKGYATEAAKAMIKFAHEKFGINHFTCSHAVENKASGRVIEKCGLHFVKYGEYTKLDGTCKRRSMEYEGEYLDSVIEGKIKKIGEKEIPECVSVIRKSFKTVADQFGFTQENAPRFTAFATTEGRLLWQLNEEHRPMYAYFNDGKIVGYYSLFLQENNECELNNVCVLPENRHLGIGEKLVAHAIGRARNLGCKKINIGIVEENTVLRKWYEELGFNHIGVKKFDFFPFTCGYMEQKI